MERHKGRGRRKQAHTEKGVDTTSAGLSTVDPTTRYQLLRKDIVKEQGADQTTNFRQELYFKSLLT